MAIFGFLDELAKVLVGGALLLALTFFLPFLLSLPGRIQRLFVKDPVPQEAISSAVAPVSTSSEVRDLADLLAPLRRRYKLPALAAALVKDGNTIALGAVGVRRAGHSERVGLDDCFHLGSCTKAMTAPPIWEQTPQ